MAGHKSDPSPTGSGTEDPLLDVVLRPEVRIRQWQGLDCRSLPPGERELGMSLESNIFSLQRHGEAFVAAVALFGFCQMQGGRNLFSDWAFLAARDGAMSIRNYLVDLNAARGLIGRIPTWTAQIDAIQLRKLERLFRKQFPFAEKMRHSVAHPEFYNDPTKKMGVEGTGEFGGISMIDCSEIVVQSYIYNNSFHATFEGAAITYSLDDAAQASIVETTHRVLDCFAAPSR